MKITFEIQSTEIKEVVMQQIKKEAVNYFNEHKDGFIKDVVIDNTKQLKQAGFFTRSVSSSLNKAVFDKVNREFSGLIENKLTGMLETAIKNLNIEQKIKGVLDKKVKEKLLEMLK